LHRRHRRKSTLVTSNLGFTEWRSFLKNAAAGVAPFQGLNQKAITSSSE
jgi:hypothetical protein